MRINPQGIYARAIEEYDYVVPRGGYFFEVRFGNGSSRRQS